MAERNYLNSNEIYPILDIINRKVKRMNSQTKYYTFENPITDDGGQIDQEWEVETFEVFRDIDNPVDSNVIEKVEIIYRNGAIETITFERGLRPPVEETVMDHEFINHIMIVAVNMATSYMGEYREIRAEIIRDNGYGLFKKVNITYTDNGVDWDELDDSGIEEMSPEDFYGGGYAGEDSDLENAEDYAGTAYEPGDGTHVPSSGWSDGYNPSNPVDITIGEED